MGSLRILRTLVAVVEFGSVVGAARFLGYSPAAISRQIAALQRQLGVRLFVPEGRGIRPTALAVQLVDRARQVVQQADDLEDYLRVIRLSSAPQQRDLTVP